jgi:hypothetical protein
MTRHPQPSLSLACGRDWRAHRTHDGRGAHLHLHLGRLSLTVPLRAKGWQ